MTSRLRRRKSGAPFIKLWRGCARKPSRGLKACTRPRCNALVGRATAQAQAADQAIVDEVSAANVELDELYSFAGLKYPEAGDDLEVVGQHWTHCAMVRESRLLLEVVVGPRTEETATQLVSGAASRLAPDCWPLWSSDGWKAYARALLSLFCMVIHFLRAKRRGRPKQPQVVPDPRLRYGQVVKERQRRRLISVTRRVVFGVAELIPLAAISTSLLERLNGTIRQHVASLHRKARSFAKCRSALEAQAQLFKSYYNLCLRHGTLQGRTPAQAAGLTDHSWTLRELLTYNSAVTSKIM
jgi:IS1 family transposase